MMMMMMIFVYLWCATALFRPLKRYDKKCVNSRLNSKNEPKLRIFYTTAYTSSKKDTTAGCVVVTNISYEIQGMVLSQAPALRLKRRRLGT